MKDRLRSFAIATLLSLVLIPASTSTAREMIPCIGLPILTTALSPAPTTVTGTLGIEKVLAGPGSGPAGNTATPMVDGEDEDAIQRFGRSLHNVVLCAQWHDPDLFPTLVTGEYRATHMGIATPGTDGDPIALADSLRVLRITGATFDDTDTVTGIAELLLDNERLLTVSMTFVEVDGEWYLDDSAVLSADDVDSWIEVTLAGSGTLISRSVANAEDIVVVRLENESEVTYDYVLVPADTTPPSRIDATVAPLRAGIVWSYDTTDVSNVAVFGIHDLEPGMYALVLTPNGNDDRDRIVLRIEVE